ncbi:MAG: ABC transporter permease subunit [Anaerolineales bacterium]|nr:ABC transporter permease subunit [Anaerolineales bacterium]MCB9145627.1 ABC transporter permease subunit [Anaerolineales bacterium]
MQHTPATKRATPFWRDERFLQLLGQALFLIAVFGFAWIIINNMRTGLQKQGMTLGFSFISGIAGFDIAELPIVYSRSSTYLQAYTVGLLNTLIVSGIGIFFSTILGVILGVARLSKNFLINRLAALYLELMRNMSLLVFLIFWYQGLFLKLPKIKEAIIWFDSVYWTNRGIGIPWGIPTASYPTFQLFLLSGIFLALIVFFSLQAYAKRTGRAPLTSLWSALAFTVVAIVGWLVLPLKPLELSIPFANGLNLSGGKIFSPEFMALTSGLVLYTAAFIGEVVRSGILAVSNGQVEAARALGLNRFQTLRLVVFPQALRVIVPPLTSQYLNLTKNSSLAVAIGYPDMFYVSNTIINQSGRAVEMIAVVMLTYLTFSLITSLFMNWYNAKIKLVER